MGAGIAYFVSTVLVMGILGNGLWGAGMRSVQEREANILRRFKVTPISPLPILVAAMVSGWLLFLPALILLVGLAHFLYAMPLPQNWFSLFLMASLGVCSLRAIGLILAAVTNTMAEATIAIQSVYMPMLFLSGATIPAAMLPKWAQTAGAIHAGLVPGERLPGNLLPQSESVGQRRRPSAALLLTTVLGTVPGRAALPLGEGREDPAAQQALGDRGAGAVRRDGLVASATAKSIWATTRRCIAICSAPASS